MDELREMIQEQAAALDRLYKRQQETEQRNKPFQVYIGIAVAAIAVIFSIWAEGLINQAREQSELIVVLNERVSEIEARLNRCETKIDALIAPRVP